MGNNLAFTDFPMDVEVFDDPRFSSVEGLEIDHPQGLLSTATISLSPSYLKMLPELPLPILNNLSKNSISSLQGMLLIDNVEHE
jgi:hypothetical protein